MNTMNTRIFRIGPGVSLCDISRDIANYLTSVEHMETIRMVMPDGSYALYGRTACSAIRSQLAMGQSICITLRMAESDLFSVSIQSGSQKWQILRTILLPLWPETLPLRVFEEIHSCLARRVVPDSDER